MSMHIFMHMSMCMSVYMSGYMSRHVYAHAGQLAARTMLCTCLDTGPCTCLRTYHCLRAQTHIDLWPPTKSLVAKSGCGKICLVAQLISTRVRAHLCNHGMHIFIHASIVMHLSTHMSMFIRISTHMSMHTHRRRCSGLANKP